MMMPILLVCLHRTVITPRNLLVTANIRGKQQGKELQNKISRIKKNCDELLQKTDFIRRRGKARILMAHLQELDQQPEFLLDGSSGLINDSRYSFFSSKTNLCI